MPPGMSAPQIGLFNFDARVEFLGDVSDIFLYFSARGGGRGIPRRREGGGVDF